MSRLAATLRLDARLQARNKVYLIVAVAAGALGLGLRALFTPAQLHYFMPLVALSGVGATSFILVGVLLMLERGEGTLDVVLISPLRPGEYLASKLLTVAALALIEGIAISGLAYGPSFALPWLMLALLQRALLVAAIGVSLAVRYHSITDFLLPVVVLILAFDLPILWYLQLWPHPVFYLWPTLPSLLLARAAFMPVDTLELVYALVYGWLAVGAALLYALHAIDRFMTRGGPVA